jgi:hypothetical protein
MAGVLEEYKHGTLHSGSQSGPVVKNRAQAVAIGLSEQRAQGKHVAAPPASMKALHKAAGGH